MFTRTATLCLMAIFPFSAALFDSTACEGDTPAPPVLDHDVVFMANNPLHQPIPPDAQTDPDSALYVEHMAAVQQASGLMMVLNQYAAPVYYADQSTPRFDVFLDVYGTVGYYNKQWLLDVPIPEEARADPGSDKHMTVVDRALGCVYDFWGYNNNLGVPKPNAWWASAIETDSDGIYRHCLGAGSAANFSFINGAVWPDELASGEIQHALTFGYDYRAVRAGKPVKPAEHNDGSSTEIWALPEGAHVQLDPTLDLSTLGLAPHEIVIAKALQTYGMYLIDGSGGPISIHAISGQSADPNPWVGVVPSPEDNAILLNKIPVSRFRVLTLPQPHDGVSFCENSRCGTYE